MPRVQHPEIELEAEDYAQADRDLGQQGLPGSLLYAGIWGLVMTTTPVVTGLPNLTWSALLVLLLSGLVRMSLGLLFDRLHPPDPRRWLIAYYAVVLCQAAVWGGLVASLIWYYATAWPAMFTSFATAGIAAGGTIALSTHPSL